MKKIFIAVLAVATLASCAQEEIISYNEQAIEFGDAFVNNSTKAIYETGREVQKFQVWGTVTGTKGTVALYEGANVTRPDGKGYGDAWSCDVTRFWTPSCTYAFYAVVDATKVNATAGVPQTIEYTADGTTDLLYGTANASTNADNEVTGVNTNNAVAFELHHLLSLVNVSFKNSVSTSDNAYTYEITDVKVTGWEKGIYTVNGDTWAQDGSSTKALSFNGIPSLTYDTAATNVGCQLIIPNQPIVISFTYNEKIKGNTYLTKTISQQVVANAQNNYQYNITVEFSKDDEILFSVDSVGPFTTTTGDVTIE